MRESGWRVCVTPHELQRRSSVPATEVLSADWATWLSRSGLVPGAPYLICPPFDYDIELNAFFWSTGMQMSARTTQLGYARDLAAFLNFVRSARHGRGWREVEESDHLAYWRWRRMDPDGPRVSGRTWDREVAAANRFFAWQVTTGHIRTNPIPQRDRPAPPIASGLAGGSTSGSSPATYSHDRAGERVEWLPPASYRLWRDVGVRGHLPTGFPDPRFRGRWAARNSAFCDLMVRTGLRLSEQSALTVFDVPSDLGVGGYQRFWLPAAVAKGGSARRVYVPESVVRDLAGYANFDRAEVVEKARADGRFRRLPNPLVVSDPERPVITRIHAGVRTRVKLVNLGPEDRRRVLVDGPAGLSPAAFWLSEFGTPITVSTWKGMFATANTRCRRVGVPLTAHAHMLRHTFAVVTLEQLQRGHIAALAHANPEQRQHWTHIFGDPLDWVRRRLGHRSVVTTQIYLHALAELEMETRAALVPGEWDDVHDVEPDRAVTSEFGPEEMW